MNRVVCLKDRWTMTMNGGPRPNSGHPVKGEVYTVSSTQEPGNGNTYYLLKEFPQALYATTSFRPVDDTFGELVAEIAESMRALEKVEEQMEAL